MEEKRSILSKLPLFSLRRLSIRQQLPLLICLLLTVLMVVFGTVSYMGVRRAALGIGQQRLRTLTEQLATMFKQSARTLAGATQAVANREEMAGYLEKQDASSAAAAQKVLQQLLADSQSVRVELLDLQGREVL